MKNYLKPALILFCLSTLSQTFAQNDKTPWKTLFNGENLNGWEIIGNTGIVQVTDSMIICNQIPNTKEHTFVTTKKRFKDFILEMDIKTDSTCNSGILLRTKQATKTCDTCYVSLYGYQVKLDSRLKRQWTGGIFYDYGKTWHWLYSLENDERARNAHNVGDWDHFRIEAIGPAIKVWINDIPVTNMINSDHKEGNIAIKIHWMPDLPEKDIKYGRYKNIKIITKNLEKYSKSMDIPAREVK